MEKYKNVISIATLVLLFLNLVATCTTNSKVKTLSKTVRDLDTVVTEVAARPIPLTDAQTRDAVRDECMETTYKYLIYENDLDRGKTSLSQIRSDVDRTKAQ